jgi:hypothetical protein
LYSDVYETGVATVNDYADVQAVEVPALSQFDLVGTPVISADPPALVVHMSSFSPDWRGPSGADHVLVSGLLNGWLMPASQTFAAHYVDEDKILKAFWVSAGGLVLSLILGSYCLLRWRKVRSVLPPRHRHE